MPAPQTTETLFEDAPCPLVALDLSGQVLRLNLAAEALVSDVSYDRDRLVEGLSAAIRENAQEGEFTLRLGLTSERAMHFRLFRTGERWIAMLTDITAARSIARTEDRRLRVIEHAEQLASVGHWVSGASLQSEIDGSPGLYRILGTHRERFGGTVSALVAATHPEDRPRFEAMLAEAMTLGRPFELDHRVILPDGRLRWVSTRAQIEQSPTEVHLVGVMIDISERVHAMEDLAGQVQERTTLLNDANEALRVFVGALAHDFRSPVRAIRGYAATLADDYGATLGPDGLHAAERIQAAASRLDQLGQGLLHICRLQEAKVQPERIRVRDAWEAAGGQIQAYLALYGGEVRVSGLDERVQGNATLLALALANLVSNGLKFRRDGVAPLVRVDAVRRGDTVRISVQDNGLGVPAEWHERIFEPFERLHAYHVFEGSGLGLTTVRRATRLIGGTVSLESVPGVGSTFAIDLPVPSEP